MCVTYLNLSSAKYGSLNRCNTCFLPNGVAKASMGGGSSITIAPIVPKKEDDLRSLKKDRTCGTLNSCANIAVLLLLGNLQF